jgi:DNA topoisomerase-1
MAKVRQGRARRLPITREPHEDSFAYRSNGRRITRKREIERLEALAIPPAWTEVEIARSPSAKVLARGLDAAGRTQAIYNPAFRRKQEREKFARLIRFGEALPRLRTRVDRDLRGRRLSRDRVVACAIRLIDLQFLRVGRPEYGRKYGSYGVTTLRRSHVETTTRTVTLDFRAKSGKRQRQRVEDPRVARVVARLLELPGAEVFRFFEEDDGMARDVTSRHVNAYVKRSMGEEFSAKDFRTWGGTLLAVTALLDAEQGELESAADRAVVARRIVRHAAEQLGNTPAVAKESYIDPRVLSAVEDPQLVARLRRSRSRMRPRRHLGVEEQCVLALLAGVDRKRR